MLSLIDKVTTGTQSLVLFIENFVLVVAVVICCTGGSSTVQYVLDISHITQYLNHDKSSFMSQLNKDNSRGLQKLLTYFNETTTSASNLLLLFGVLTLK